VTTIVGYKGMGFDEIELNSVVLLCGATMFCRRLAYTKPALRRLRPVSLYGLTLNKKNRLTICYNLKNNILKDAIK